MIRTAGAAAVRLCVAAALSAALAAGLATGAEASPPRKARAAPEPTMLMLAVAEAKAKRARGERVWCVPFARTASGLEIKGDAKTWWASAAGRYDRGHDPRVGAVMVFKASGRMSRGHVAVVSEVVSDREIRIDHANWKRNQISLGMTVHDVSEKGDWSAVRVEGDPGVLGRVYPVAGFIYPRKDQAEAEAAVVRVAARLPRHER